MLISEADIREKIVAPWLSSIGIQLDRIYLEHSFSIRLGRGIYTINARDQRKKAAGRADYLIKGPNNLNLFVIETKAFDKELSLEDRDQAISYARLLVEGNIAPFTILTNGSKTIIYDTISKEPVENITAFSNHPHVLSDFNVSCDIDAQAEALQCLISFNSDTLLTFCKNQCEYRMKMLKSHDIYSGKKYIPQLYLQREQIDINFNKLLFSDKFPQQVVLVTGPPQQGKTSFLCYTVEKYLAQGIPCLFYPAIGLKSGLLTEIQDDFVWSFNNNKSINLIVSRLKTILNKLNQTLILFIDGLNEIDQAKAFEICQACERILPAIKIVISATSNSLDRLLFENDNPTCLAEYSRISRQDTRILKTKQLHNLEKKNLIQILNFENQETSKAIKVYAKAYNVEVSEKVPNFSNPFYLRIAMEKYAGKKMPVIIDTKELIHYSIIRKAKRAGIDDIKLWITLAKISNALFSDDTPITDLHKLNLKPNLLQSLCEAAILAEVHDENEMLGLDFYYSRERDFAIAHILRKWDRIFLKQNDTVLNELQNASSTTVGKEALHWFFSSSLHIKHLKKCYNVAKHVTVVYDILLQSLLNQNFQTKEDIEWLRETLTDLSNSSDISSRVTVLFKLIIALKIRPESITENQIYLIKRLLIEENVTEENDEEVDITETFSFQLMVEHGFTEVYKSFLLDEDNCISSLSAILLAHDYETTLVDTLSKFILQKNFTFIEKHENFIDSLTFLENREAENDLYCPNYLDTIHDLEDAIRAYLNYQSFFIVAKYYTKFNVFTYYLNQIMNIKEQILVFLKDEKQYISLDKYHRSIANEIANDKGILVHIFFEQDPHQLYLPLNIEYKNINEAILSKYYN